MPDIDIVADTSLSQQAIQIVEKYVNDNLSGSLRQEKDWPIARAQIAGLRQIAFNEPSRVGEFAKHQRSKVEAKLATTQNEERKRELEAKITFWELVRGLCDGNPQISRLAAEPLC